MEVRNLGLLPFLPNKSGNLDTVGYQVKDTTILNHIIQRLERKPRPPTKRWFWHKGDRTLQNLIRSLRSAERYALAYHCASHSAWPILERAFAHGMSLQATNQTGYTLLMLACHLGCEALAEYLLQHRANKYHCCQHGHTAMDIAIIQRKPAIIQLLLKFNYSPTVTNAHGYAPLHQAAIITHNGICQLLVQYGADKNQRDARGFTPLLHALLWADLELLTTLHTPQQQKLIRKYQTKFYPAVAKRALHEQHYDPLLFLFAAGISPNTKIRLETPNEYMYTTCDGTLLHYAVHYECKPLIQILCKHNVNVDLRDRYGNTALLLACKYCFEDIVDLLLQHNANPTLSNHRGLDPVDATCKPGIIQQLAHAKVQRRQSKKISNSLN